MLFKIVFCYSKLYSVYILYSVISGHHNVPPKVHHNVLPKVHYNVPPKVHHNVPTGICTLFQHLLKKIWFSQYCFVYLY